MGKPTGFIDYERVDAADVAPAERVKTFDCFHGSLGEEERRQQAARCMDCGVPFCQAGLSLDGKLVGCPLHNLIPEWNDQLWEGNLDIALERLLATNCFPEFTGYVCPVPCEGACSCAKNGEAVSINANERHIIEQAFARGLMQPRPAKRASGLSVAVVGAGPAGLTVAYLLNRRGHAVTVFEREQTPGGLLVYGIPSMKLPREVVARRVALLEAEGVRFECGVDVGHTLALAEVQERFDAVVLATGAQDPRVVPFEGEAQGVCYALDYLGAVAREQLGEAPLDATFDAKGKVVAIIGAGDSANDCIATALRQGASDVIQLIRRPKESYAPMRDYAHEEVAAVFDHDIRRFQTQVARVVADEAGKLTELVLSTPAGEERVKADLLVVASGFKGTEPYLAESASEEALAETFLAGDVTLGSSLVVLAMANARTVANQVETKLLGYSSIH